MNLSTIGRYLIGDAAAIQRIAADSKAIWTGVVLVLLTAIARNYDQAHYSESRLWLFGPLLFSLVSGTFLYTLVYGGCIQGRMKDEMRYFTGRSWQAYMSLFWMTAPIAWLYAIPVERFFDSYTAAKANLTLLGIVAVWRVLLMSRAVSVIHQSSFGRTLCWVSVAACIEVLVVFFFGQAFARKIMAAMGGLRNSPEEELMMSAMGSVFALALILLIVLVIGLLCVEYNDHLLPVPARKPSKFPSALLLATSAIWVVLAIGPQREQKRFVEHASLVKTEAYRESIEYLAHHTPRDFPVSRRLEPNPYERGVFEALPKLVAALRPTDPQWIRTAYLEHVSAMLTHRPFHWTHKPALLNQMFAAIEQLEEGRAWADLNRETIMMQIGNMVELWQGDKDMRVSAEAIGLRSRLEYLGIHIPAPATEPQK